VWVIWVLGRTQPTSAVVDLLIFLVATALAAWVWGKVQWLQAPQKIAALALALSVLGIVGWWALDFDDAPEPTRETTPEKAPESRAITGGPSTWSAYDANRVRSEVAAGRIVFVDFTADWCITCKVNERGVLSDEETLQMFRDRGVVPMVADWTRRDDEIRRVLARHGKAGVPMYLVFAPGSPDTPEVLPELLTLDRLRESLDRARPEP
jgi:thiol:disulfide interchange protein DsbD